MGFRDGQCIMARESPDIRASIVELQALLLGTESIDGFLRELAVLAARTLGAGLSCGITLQPNGRPLTVASSDGFASQVDELQYKLDEGPCLSRSTARSPSTPAVDKSGGGMQARAGLRCGVVTVV